MGKCNSNNLLLTQTFAVYYPSITNKTYSLPICNKTSFMQPKSKHLTDYVIGRKKDMQDVKVTKIKCGADCRTDHRLIVSKRKLCITSKRQLQWSKGMERINVAKLNNPSITSALAEDFETKLGNLYLVGMLRHTGHTSGILSIHLHC